MRTTRKFGAISFLAENDGRYVVAGKVAANKIAGAIARVGELHQTLVKELTPRVDAVAFEPLATAEAPQSSASGIEIRQCAG